ncbi:dnaJ homolog subfamily C member 30, mitochondrial-like [Stigmatopora argus]
MAEVMLRSSRRTLNISNKLVYHYRPLKPPRKNHGNATVISSCLSGGLLSADLNHNRLREDVKNPKGHGDPLAIFFPQISAPRGSCWGHLTFTRTYGNGDREEPLYRSRRGYYDILGVTPTASLAQIKTAYYKQCFLYHPDRNAGNDQATVRFSDISEAYAVLSHKTLRRKYDRGLLSQNDLTTKTGAGPSASPTATTATTKADGWSSSTVARRERMFDFDEFLRSHYGEQLQRDKDTRQRKEERLKRQRETMAERNKESTVELGVVLLLMAAIALIVTLRSASR